MTIAKTEFQKISKDILKEAIAEEKKQADCARLYDWFCRNSKTKDYLNNSHTYLDSGQALSVQEAGECILDYKRTITFLQAIKAAINDLQILKKDKIIEILYAGTGPFATLILPVLHLYSPKRIQITLIDIHKEAIQNVQFLIDSLSYQEYIKEYLVEDATKITFSEGRKFDLIISETMNQALIKEPQASITNNLIPYLSSHGIFIPEEINISVACSRYSDEPNLTQNRDEYVFKNFENKHKEKRIELGHLFSLNKKSILELYKKEMDFESSWLPLPKEYKKAPDISLFTEIRVYKYIRLNHGDSIITNPYCIASIPNFPDKTHIKLRYTIQDYPKWSYDLK